MADIHDSRIIDLPVIADPRGNLSIIEQFNQIPFEIRRTYWIYDVPGGKDRGEHALKESEEFIVALSGSFDVMLDDGTTRKFFPLNRNVAQDDQFFHQFPCIGFVFHRLFRRRLYRGL